MGKKGRHGRSRSRGAAALVARVSDKTAAAGPSAVAGASAPAMPAAPLAEPLPVPTESVSAARELPPVTVSEPRVEGALQASWQSEEVTRPEIVTPPSRARIETPVAFASPQGLDRDDESIPAVDLDSPFFSESSHPQLLAHGTEEHHEERDPRQALKMTPEAARRRAQLQKYVRFAVGAASALCLAALVKVAVARNHEEPAAARASAAAAVVQVAPPAAPMPVETALPLEAVPPPADPPAADPVAAADPAPATDLAPATSTAPATALEPTPATAQPDPAPAAPADIAAPEPDPKEASKAKRASQVALERGKIADAIEAGEQSVLLDPSDAEAWLILGAAYQEKGDIVSARRSFRACLKEGKRGPKWECAQMPH